MVKVVIKKSYLGNGKPVIGQVARMTKEKAKEMIEAGNVAEYDGPVPMSHNITTYNAGDELKSIVPDEEVEEVEEVIEDKKDTKKK